MLNQAKLLSSGNVHIHLSFSWGEACKPAILCISLESQRASDSMPDRYSYALQQGTVFWELPGKLSSASNGNLLNLAEAFLGFNLFKLPKKKSKTHMKIWASASAWGAPRCGAEWSFQSSQKCTEQLLIVLHELGIETYVLRGAQSVLIYPTWACDDCNLSMVQWNYRQ